MGSGAYKELGKGLLGVSDVYEKYTDKKAGLLKDKATSDAAIRTKDEDQETAQNKVVGINPKTGNLLTQGDIDKGYRGPINSVSSEKTSGENKNKVASDADISRMLKDEAKVFGSILGDKFQLGDWIDGEAKITKEQIDRFNRRRERNDQPLLRVETGEENKSLLVPGKTNQWRVVEGGAEKAADKPSGELKAKGSGRKGEKIVDVDGQEVRAKEASNGSLWLYNKETGKWNDPYIDDADGSVAPPGAGAAVGGGDVMQKAEAQAQKNLQRLHTGRPVRRDIVRSIKGLLSENAQNKNFPLARLGNRR